VLQDEVRRESFAGIELHYLGEEVARGFGGVGEGGGERDGGGAGGPLYAADDVGEEVERGPVFGGGRAELLENLKAKQIRGVIKAQ